MMKTDSNDNDLIHKAINGNKRAFNTIVNKYKQRVYYTAMKMVRNKDDAYDITQDVFVKAYKNLGKFKGDSNLFTWLCRIAINTSLNYKGRDKFRGMVSVSDLSSVPVSPIRPDREFFEQELFNRLEEAVNELPQQQKTVFVMRYYNQMPHNQIAKVLGRSEGAVKANYFQALQKLKGAFSDLLPPNSNISAVKNGV
ncbi:MAG: sigma-70 family RNA polymerase sigma factor [candidate division Zixibacteria bacterium]|nr:sigma-70 family RNA polymerase sigma factor [candidate division Zixibacteria bacterium]